ncbi:hypothetical protein BGZ99_009009 [Dissophora globulifera]|uniref:BTB domain-containing protein n=1 Tax=Dissophora globulifera TaxID=979702 RepID=A0A9P6UNT9_9FUNG|nr:hypothetical protein BGZ99_009009 [Dissophora globulifera]
MSSLLLRDDSVWILNVDSPTLPTSTSQNCLTSTITAAQTSHLTWTVFLEKKIDNLRVLVILSLSPSWNSDARRPVVKAIHIVPCFSPHLSSTVFSELKALSSGAYIEGVININEVLHNNRYIFDIVLTTSTELPRKRIEPLEPVKVFKPSKTAIRNSEFMQALLKDPYSVDIRFVFNTDESYSNIGLWAHRSLLSRYKPFADLIRDAFSESVAPTSSCNISQSIINAEMLTIPLHDISPATLCVLLRYIYTGEINRTVDTTLHVISMTDSALVMKGISGRPARIVRWSPMDKDSPWRLKDVTWEELLRASGRFGVLDLQQHCEDAVIASIDTSNAVEVLFSIGGSFDKVKDSAMDFIVDKMGVVLEGEDPFAAYKSHPDAFEFLVELLRRKTTKSARTDWPSLTTVVWYIWDRIIMFSSFFVVLGLLLGFICSK